MKIFPYAQSLIDWNAGEIISEENPIIEISEKGKDEFFKEKPQYFGASASASEKISAENSYQYKVDEYYYIERSAIDAKIVSLDEKSAFVSFKFLKSIKRKKASEDKFEKFGKDESFEVLNKVVNLGTLTVVQTKVYAKQVKDVVPFWGDLPFIGRFFQTPAVSYSAKVVAVLLEEDDSKETE